MAYDKSEEADDGEWAPVHETVRRFVLRRYGRADFADDIAQETVLRVIRYRRENAVENLYAFALRVAANLAAEHQRRENRWPSDELSEEIASVQPSPERIVEGRQAVETLAVALQRMPSQRREVIIRRRVRHQSCAEIARDLGISVKAVEKHVTRGLLDLNKAFGPMQGRSGNEGSDQ